MSKSNPEDILTMKTKQQIFGSKITITIELLNTEISVSTTEVNAVNGYKKVWKLMIEGFIIED